MRHHVETIDCSEAQHQGLVATYLRIAGDECAFIETATSHTTSRMLETLARQGLRPESVRYVIVTHAHLDHSAGAAALMAACPNATLLAHPRAARHLIDPTKLIAGATAVYGPERFTRFYGQVSPISAARVQALADGASFALGDAILRVHHTAGHANHHFVIHDQTADCVFTGDAFGLVYPALQAAGRFALPSTSPSNFDGAEAIASLRRIEALGATRAYLTHFGGHDDMGLIGAQLTLWLEQASAWCEAAAASGKSLEVLTFELIERWRSAVARESVARGLGFGLREWGVLALDLELNGQGLAVAALQRRPGG